jgi:hypothetical protein
VGGSVLCLPAGEVVYLPQLEGNRVGKGLLWLVGAYGKKQQLRNGASVLYQGITEAAENPELQQGMRGWAFCGCTLL